MTEQNKRKHNRISGKLRSETGASITFALLLFLVCAALSAVIIVAATTASGRMSGLAEADQKYYATISAAELISDLMDDESVSVLSLSVSHISEDSKVVLDKPIDEVSDEDLKTIVIIPPDAEDPDDTNDEDTVEEPTDDTITPQDPDDPEPGEGESSLRGMIAELYRNSITGSDSEINLSSSLTDDPLAVTIKTESVEKTEGTNEGTMVLSVVSSGEAGNRSKVLMYFSIEDVQKMPPVTKIHYTNGDTEYKRIVTDGHEYTWHLEKIVSGKMKI